MASEQAERLFFRIAVKRGYLTPADARLCQERAERARARGRGASASAMALREGLIDAQTHRRLMRRVLSRETSKRRAAETEAEAGPRPGVAEPKRASPAAPLGSAERSRLGALLGKRWEVVEDHHLEARFEFPDLGAALAFVQLLGRLAMERGREPDVHLHGREVQVAVWTEAIDGLSTGDFDFASRVERLTFL
ncbi:MAG: 4a-hydroxytetrahydrobiopterin dehydratase [Planctomycetes bacterium]|nr:4a-hydroxytetrahydrobiopterin dehydratase [Planctomycetota bacterium]